MSHRIVLGALSSLEHALGTSPLVVVSTTRQFLERSMGRREGGSGTAGMACSELSEWTGERDVSSGAATSFTAT